MSHNHHSDSCDQHQSGEEEEIVSLTAEHSGHETGVNKKRQITRIPIKKFNLMHMVMRE